MWYAIASVASFVAGAVLSYLYLARLIAVLQRDVQALEHEYNALLDKAKIGQ